MTDSMGAKAGNPPLFAFARPALRGKPDESARELERLLSEMEWVDAQGNGKHYEIGRASCRERV